MTGHAHHGPPSAPSADAVVPPGTAKAPDVSSFRLLATLALAGAAAGLLVVAVYRATLPTIERYSAAKVEVAVREVLKSPARWDTLYLQKGALTKTPTTGDNPKDLPKAYVGFDESGKRLGAAVTAQEPGFQEEVLLMIGFEPSSGTLIGFKVVEQKETPGLGDKIERDTSFGSQFAGRVAPLKGVKARDPSNPSQVQTITGATISSRAVIRIINHAVEKWQPLLATYEKGGTK
ncbi:MAG TPA: RnfABCDGE type electron transport complex subunit G [Gemmatimonadaceae bacterium]|nr:RnfABCDGE type electron transport complex subunit G [Gemmatimonadaceae bacterium]